MFYRTNPLVVIAIAALTIAFTSCTESFKHKQATADELLDEMKASSVMVGYASKAEAGSESTKTTTLTFSGVEEMDDYDQLEYRANRVAHDFYAKVGMTDLKDETHLEIVANGDDGEYSFPFVLSELGKMDENLAVADAALLACHESDSARLESMIDANYVTAEVLGDIYSVNAFNDSLFSGQTFDKKQIGYRIFTPEGFPELDILSVDYECGNDQYYTLYTIDVDCRTGKVVHISMDTEER